MCSLWTFLLDMSVEALHLYKYQMHVKPHLLMGLVPESTFVSFKNERWFLVLVCHMTIIILHSGFTQNLNFSS